MHRKTFARHRRLSFGALALVAGAGVFLFAALPYDAGGRQEATASQPAANDSLIRLAEQALASGRPWRATEILTPVIRDSARRTPAALLVAARAASAWQGWPEVQRILQRESWLDSLYSGEGRALLARAQLERGEDSNAVNNARLALAQASEPARGKRTVLLARALAAIKDAQGAEEAYRSAAQQLPDIGDWLRLRAAEWIADSSARATLLATVTLPHAASRVALVDAAAAENTADTLGAIGRYTRLGNLAPAFRLRLAIASTAADSSGLRTDIMAALGRSPTAAAARSYVDVFDEAFRTNSPAEDLTIARALGSAGGERATQSYARAFRGGVGTTTDRFQYATILARLGSSEAINQFGLVTSPPALAASARYQQGRTMLRLGATEWSAALRGVVSAFPEDTSAGTALFLLADVATDDGRDSAARETFLASATRYPGGSRAAQALFNAAMIAYIRGEYDVAARDFESLRNKFPQSAEVTSSTYWRGRSLEKTGDTTAFAAACARIRTTDSLSYYSALCSRRTGVPFWTPTVAPDSFVAFPAVDSIANRVRLLREIDLANEAALELDRIRVVAGSEVEQLMSAANTLRELGEGSRALALAQLAQTRGVRRDTRLYRLLYPATHLEMVAAEASQHGLDMDLVAGLIRQESLFNPSATSPAGARGLMQIMPPVGGDLARAAGFPVWDPVLLWQPDVNARLGVQHFADLITSQQHIYHVLASYNAGASRVERWLTKAGSADPEVFVERIPYVETRDYVRILTRNRESYRILYGR